MSSVSKAPHNPCAHCELDIDFASEAPSFESVLVSALGGGGLASFAYGALGVSAVVVGMAAGAAFAALRQAKH